MSGAESSPIRVVIADDVDDVRLVMKLSLLDAGGFEVVGEAADGSEACDVVLATDPDLLLLDLAMPRVDGLQAIERLKKEAPRTKIVVLSNQGRALIAEAMDRGADAFLDKTGTFELIPLLRGVVSGTGDQPQ